MTLCLSVVITIFTFFAFFVINTVKEGYIYIFVMLFKNHYFFFFNYDQYKLFSFIFIIFDLVNNDIDKEFIRFNEIVNL